jgi:hypothetical protein
MTVFKNKLHHLITGQLPEYIVEEYPIFVDFLTAYYSFMDADTDGGDPGLPGANNILLNTATWQDVDLTLDLFIPEFRKQFAYDIPEDALIDSRRIIKYIYDYYESKGSENAAELFFRFMYDETASVAYPGDYILRASDGRWYRKRYIKIDATGYQDKDIYALAGSVIQLRYNKDYGAGVGVKEIITGPISCYSVVEELEANIYQVEVDIAIGYEFPAVIAPPAGVQTTQTFDTYVYVLFDGVEWGTLTKQLISVKSIDIPGKNFRIDDAYEIGESGIEGKYFAGVSLAAYVVIPPVLSDSYVLETYSNHAIIRVKDVTKVVEGGVRGQILKFQIVDTGQRFTCRESNSVGTLYYMDADYSQLSNVYTYGAGYDSKYYAHDNEEIVPVDTFTLQLYPTHAYDIDPATEQATITFNTGLVYVAEGLYKGVSGFLSDVTKLQDNYYYQPYSYVIRSQQPFNVWKNIYTKSNHPAGFKVFAELQFVDTIVTTVTAIEFNPIILPPVECAYLLYEDDRQPIQYEDQTGYVLLATGCIDAVVVTTTTTAAPENLLLLETGDFVLQETGDFTALEV